MATATRYRSGEGRRRRQARSGYSGGGSDKLGAARGGDSDKLQERRGVATATRYRSGEGCRRRQARIGALDAPQFYGPTPAVNSQLSLYEVSIMYSYRLLVDAMCADGGRWAWGRGSHTRHASVFWFHVNMLLVEV